MGLIWGKPVEEPGYQKLVASPSPKGAKKPVKATEKKEFKCTVEGCDKTYAYKSSLTSHIKNMHPEPAIEKKKVKPSTPKKTPAKKPKTPVKKTPVKKPAAQKSTPKKTRTPRKK